MGSEHALFLGSCFCETDFLVLLEGEAGLAQYSSFCNCRAPSCVVIRMYATLNWSMCTFLVLADVLRLAN